MWNDDAVFRTGGALQGSANPGFRLSMLLAYDAAHPYLHAEAYEVLFALYAPILRDHCDRIRMWDRPGARARRGKKIQPGDWTPFHHIRSVHSDVEHGIFTGFYFVDRQDESGMGMGPCSFRFFVGRCIRLDVSIPLMDWNMGRLAAEAMVAAVQALPYLSFVAGFGLALAEDYMAGDTTRIDNALADYAQCFPAVDIETDESRAGSSGTDERGLPKVGLVGVNWLTGVGAPFLARHGPAISDGLPPAIGVTKGRHGIVFRLGDAPISGEAGVDEATLPFYHTLGERLAGIWRPRAGMRPPVFGDQRIGESLAWEQRFFGAGR